MSAPTHNDDFLRFAARFASACTTGAFAADLRRLRETRIAAGVMSPNGSPVADAAQRPAQTQAA
jgi:hypothetical protein